MEELVDLLLTQLICDGWRQDSNPGHFIRVPAVNQASYPACNLLLYAMGAKNVFLYL